MATIIKILGQSLLSDTALTNIYEVPAGSSAIISTILVQNVTSTLNNTFRIAVGPTAGSVGAANYLYYNIVIPDSGNFAATLGITLEAGKFISAQCSAANRLTFHVWGQEISS